MPFQSTSLLIVIALDLSSSSNW